MPPLLLMLCLAASPDEDAPEAKTQGPTRPRRVAYTEPQFPAAARQVSPPLEGIVILEMTLNEEGRPADIKVLRPIPLLDRAAVDAARQWLYEPTLVDGVPTRVVVEEIVDMFPDQEARARYWVGMLGKSSLERPFRIFAAHRLASIGLAHKQVLEALRKAASDNDQDLRLAAARALETLEAIEWGKRQKEVRLYRAEGKGLVSFSTPYLRAAMVANDAATARHYFAPSETTAPELHIYVGVQTVMQNQGFPVFVAVPAAVKLKPRGGNAILDPTRTDTEIVEQSVSVGEASRKGRWPFLKAVFPLSAAGSGGEVLVECEWQTPDGKIEREERTATIDLSHVR